MQRQLEGIAKKYGARLIVQFGSTVSGKTHPRSDVDIAVMLECPDLSFGTHAELHHDLQSLFPHREIDLVILNRADPLLLKQVADRFICLFGAEQEIQRFRLLAFKRYHDHARYLRMEREYVQRAFEQDLTAP